MSDFNLLTIEDTMKLLKIKSFVTFQKRYLKQGLPVISVGGSKRVALDDIKKFVDDHKTSDYKPNK